MSTNPAPESPDEFDYDYVVIGSGFGGSVSAMRLAQKGYRVLVLEAGRRWQGRDFPKSNWNIFRFLWAPAAFCYGIMRITLLRNVMIVSGAGVGGGSLVYANTLYVPKKKFFEHAAVHKMGGEKALMPFYRLAERMLGVVKNPRLFEVDDHMRATAAEMGAGDSFTPTPVAIYFGDRAADDKTKIKSGRKGVRASASAAKETSVVVTKDMAGDLRAEPPRHPAVRDPYFGGEGPDRVPCNFCGGCMVGCKFNSKNTLDKNYLYFAEKLGAEILPETKAVDIAPLSEDGSAGYEIRAVSSVAIFGGFRKKHNRRIRARGIVLSAGVLGSVNLLLKLKASGRLRRLSDRLGSIVRTNSESIVGVTSLDRGVDFSRGLAITSSVHIDEHTHLEPVRYPAGSDLMGGLASLMTDGGGAVPRPLKFLVNVARHPVNFLRTAVPLGFAKKSILILAMQTLDNSINLVRRRRWFWPFGRGLTSTQAKGQEIPTYIPEANEFARRLAKRVNGIPLSSYNEVLLDVPTTAHILGGACLGESPKDGVIDLENQVHGYRNLYVCDGSMVPANPGVNPSLTITALSEHAMSKIPPKSKAGGVHLFEFEKLWKVGPTIAGPGAGSGGAAKKKPRTKAGGRASEKTAKPSGKKSPAGARKKSKQTTARKTR
ncbi:MAG: GMC family oxidoreductase [bacterium]|nr:GMC family oxidoreductase [bacterium]